MNIFRSNFYFLNREEKNREDSVLLCGTVIADWDLKVEF